MVVKDQKCSEKNYRKDLKFVSLTVKDNYEREKLMHMDNELAAKRRRILLVNDIFNHGIELVVLSLDTCLFFNVASNDKQLLNSLPKTDSLPFHLLK